MFRLFQYVDNKPEEVFPENGTYNVYELIEYDFSYIGVGTLQNEEIFLEDIPLQYNQYRIETDVIYSKRDRFFQDYFGYTALSINNEIFNLNIKIEKLKISEIEDIFMYLWGKDHRILNLFFSKSVQTLGFNHNGFEYITSSKFLNIIDIFCETFEKLLPLFKTSPHTVLKTVFKTIDYSDNNVSPYSLDWLLNNLDGVHISHNLHANPDAFKINQTYGIIEKIETDIKQNSCLVYENEIVLGAFLHVISKLTALRKEILSNINLNTDTKRNKDTKYADFKELKKLPFLKLYENSNIIGNKIRSLYSKYKLVFKNVVPKCEKPKLTSVFSNRSHYRKAFVLIKNVWDLKFNLAGEYHLMNIRKLSQLYEVYNLYQITDCFYSKLKIEQFKVEVISNRKDELISKISFASDKITINIFYEPKYYDSIQNINELNLVRIDNSKNYYCPDYVVEIKKENIKKYYILDSKYTKIETLKSKYLNDCIFKYILDTGIYKDPYKKIENLALIYPSEKGESYLENNFYKPTITLIASKPNFEGEIRNYINKIIQFELPIGTYNY